MKTGTRALGVAESYRGEESTVAGCVVRADRAVDGLAFTTWTVGGTDATAATIDLVDRLDREDVGYLLLAGIAPAWFNVLDLDRIHEATGLATLSVGFEQSEGLVASIQAEFPGEEGTRRVETYRRQPPRRPVTVGEEQVFVRGVGLDDDRAARVVRGFTADGGRPEPLRVARLAARAVDAFRHEG